MTDEPATTDGDSAPDVVTEAAAPDTVGEPNAPETDDDSDVDADTDALDDEDACKPGPTPDGSPTEKPQDEPPAARSEAEPLDLANSNRLPEAPTATMLEAPDFENTEVSAAWAKKHLDLELEPKHPLYLLRIKIDRAVAERNRGAASDSFEAPQVTDIAANGNDDAGKMCLDAGVLAERAERLPGIEYFLRLRRVMKLISTYGAGLADAVHPVDGAIHSDLKIGGARTGRMKPQCKKNLKKYV